MTTSELVQLFVDKIQRGEITFDKVRPELMSRGMAENEIRMVVRQVDEELQNRLLSGQKFSPQLIVVGTVILALGLVLTIGIHAGLFSSIRSYVALFGYIPIVSGIAMIFVALKRRRGTKARTFGSRLEDEKGTNKN